MCFQVAELFCYFMSSVLRLIKVSHHIPHTTQDWTLYHIIYKKNIHVYTWSFFSIPEVFYCWELGPQMSWPHSLSSFRSVILMASTQVKVKGLHLSNNTKVSSSWCCHGKDVWDGLRHWTAPPSCPLSLAACSCLLESHSTWHCHSWPLPGLGPVDHVHDPRGNYPLSLSAFSSPP